MTKISPQKAIELNQNFIKTRSNAIDKAIGKKDAISSWFSLDELKEYIAFVEKKAKEQGIVVNGLRVYFGAYSKNDKKLPKNNLATAFFAPTKPRTGSLLKDSLSSIDGGSDIDDIEPLNDGGSGHPPSAPYPQT